MDTIGKRLKHLIESQGLNNTSFGEKFDIDNKSLSEITRDKRNLGIVLINRIIEQVPELNLNWLIQGKGTMYVGENVEYTKTPKVEEPIKLYLTDEPGKMMLLRYLDDGDVRQKIREILK